MENISENSKNSEKAQDSEKIEEQKEKSQKEASFKEDKKNKKTDDKETSFKEDRIRNIALPYYSRQDIRKAIFSFSKNREIVPRYFEGFGKRPDALQYDSDILAFVKKGATSFHCSEELWKDSLQLSTELSEEQLNELREGWDLLIDIDSKYLDYSKTAAQLLIQALEFHQVKNIGIKFSGSKGFHIIIPWKAFPEEIHSIKTKNMFPEWARMICVYLREMIKNQLIERITDLMNKSGDEKNAERKSYVKDFEAPKQVMPDIILVSPRHLFRMPYSLHEKTSLASIVINKNEIADFKIQDANPLKVQVKNFYPSPEPEEARELLLQAIDWQKSREQQTKKEELGKETRKGKYKDIIIKDLTPNLYPPCITSILQGIKQDGRKRALFILINFFKSLKLKDEEITSKIEQWNKKNYKPLKEGYIKSQLSWHSRQKTILPPNCDKEHYKDLQVCKPDNFCKLIKNPVNYTIKKSFLLKKQSKKRKAP